MAVFNVSCLNVTRDPETGCAHDCGGSNTYQACRQVFYLKQQNEILKQNQIKATPILTPFTTVEIGGNKPKDSSATTQISSDAFYIFGIALVVGVVIGFLLKSLLSKRK